MDKTFHTHDNAKTTRCGIPHEQALRSIWTGKPELIKAEIERGWF